MIRPLQPGDLYLIQRLKRQATRFFTVQTLLHAYSPPRAALGSVIPWSATKVTTYVLRQDGHGLVHDGFLQVQRRQDAAEADVLCLAPGLEAAEGHPAIWTKLLAHYLHAGIQQGLERIYADVSDQPLPVNTFAGVGFTPYARQTIWRLFSLSNSVASVPGLSLRSMNEADRWALSALYPQITPDSIQLAEGWRGGGVELVPWLRSWATSHGTTYVLLDQGCICGLLQLAAGPHGTWLQWWTDTLRPDGAYVRALLGHGLRLAAEQHCPMPVFSAVAEYESSSTVFLAEAGFAPFSDRVKLVKPVVKWVRETVTTPVPVIETASEVVPTAFVTPEGATSRSGLELWGVARPGTAARQEPGT